MYSYVVMFAFFFAGCIGSFFATKWHYQSQSKKLYQNLLQILDRSLHGEFVQNSYDESMDAAVVVRLNRMVQITKMHQKDAEKERDTVKALISDISHQV